MSDLKTNLGAILATDFSEGDFGVKKNLAIGALAASAALNPMKANASLPVRSDGMFYTSEFNPYPIGMFDKKTGERVKDPKKVYEATKNYQYYFNPGAYAPSVSGKDLPEITEHNNTQRDRALKQTELDEKNKLWYGNGKDAILDEAYENGAKGSLFRKDLDPSHEYKALINHRWRSVDNHGKPRNLTFNDLNFSEGDFGIKKNLAIGALAASAVLNPMKANASLPVRSDGLFYISESNPYPVGIFDQLTGERVTDPKEVYKLTKDFNYYQLDGAKGLEPGKKLSWGKADKDNVEKRDITLKQTELDQKNKMWYGDGKYARNYISSAPMDSGRIGEFRTNPYYDYKAFVDNKWYDVDKHGKPIGSREKVFSEGDFGIKKNLAIGALAASAALNPMKANASLPVRSDGMFYVSEDYPYPTGLFDKKTGKRVKDPKIVYNATKDYQYYTNSGAYGKDLPGIIEYNRDRAMKQAELDKKNKLLYGDGKDVTHNNTDEGGGGLGNKYFYACEFSEQVDLLSGKARKANVKKEAQDLESLKRRIDLIPDPSVRDALNKDWESLNKDRVSRAWVRIPGKVGVASSLASVPATVATMAVAPAVALPLAAIGGAGLALSANQVRVANRAALRPAIDQLEEKVRKAEQDTIYARMMANPTSAQIPAKA